MATITNLSTTVLQPGTQFVISGSGLSGDVLLVIPGSPVVALETLSTESAGSDTEPSTVVAVTAHVPDGLSGLPSSGDARIRIADAEIAVTFQAVTLYFLCYLADDQAGGLFGGKKDRVVGGGALGPFQTLEQVVIRKMDGGQAYLKDPSANPGDLSQGYHIGTPAAQGTRIRLYYEVSAPRGFAPSPIPGFSAWDVATGVPWLIPDNW